MPVQKVKTMRDDDDVPDTTKHRKRFAVIHRGRSRYADKRLEFSLEGARKAFMKTQVEVSRLSGIDQPHISRIEKRATFDDVEVGTLRRYVTALGGELEIAIACPNGARIVLRPESKNAEVRLVKARAKTVSRNDLFDAVTEITSVAAVATIQALESRFDARGLDWGEDEAGRRGREFEKADQVESAPGGRLQKWKAKQGAGRDVAFSLARHVDKDAFARAQNWAEKQGWGPRVWIRGEWQNDINRAQRTAG